MPGHGRECFKSGANAVISGDMLTTAGYTIESDMNMIHELGYKEELTGLKVIGTVAPNGENIICEQLKLTFVGFIYFVKNIKISLNIQFMIHEEGRL